MKRKIIREITLSREEIEQAIIYWIEEHDYPVGSKPEFNWIVPSEGKHPVCPIVTLCSVNHDEPKIAKGQ